LVSFEEAQDVEANAWILAAALVEWHLSEIVCTEIRRGVPPIQGAAAMMILLWL
jgi:hypothetical protein